MLRRFGKASLATRSTALSRFASGASSRPLALVSAAAFNNADHVTSSTPPCVARCCHQLTSRRFFQDPVEKKPGQEEVVEEEGTAPEQSNTDRAEVECKTEGEGEEQVQKGRREEEKGGGEAEVSQADDAGVVATVGAQGSDAGAGASTTALSEEVDESRRAEGEQEDEADEFDIVEAQAQEIHDVSAAMLEHLRRVHRRKYHPSALHKATQVFTRHTGVVLELLAKEDVVVNLLRSSARGAGLRRNYGVHRRHNVVKRDVFNTSDPLARVHLHAPFELQALRSDIPEPLLINARARRDRRTLQYLNELMRHKFPGRENVEDGLFVAMNKIQEKGVGVEAPEEDTAEKEQ